MADYPPPDPERTLDGRPRRRAARRLRAVPITPEMLEGAPDFAPVPRGAIRYDGWTPERQRAFVKALAETGCVTRAARWVGMSEVSAYLLRKAEGGEGFRDAWTEALTIGVARLSDVAFDRALNGVPVPVFHDGRQIGERRSYNDRLLMFTLRHHDPETYGASITNTNRIPPHVRKQLRAEWEREKAEETAEHARTHGSAVDRLMARLEQMRERMKDDPPTAKSSLAEIMAWSLPLWQSEFGAALMTAGARDAGEGEGTDGGA